MNELRVRTEIIVMDKKDPEMKRWVYRRTIAVIQMEINSAVGGRVFRMVHDDIDDKAGAI